MNNDIDLSFWDRREKIKTIVLSSALMVVGGLISVSIINAEPNDGFSGLILFISAGVAVVSFFVFLISLFLPYKNKTRKRKEKRAKNKNKTNKQEVSILTQKWVKVAIAFAAMIASGIIEVALFQFSWDGNIIGWILIYAMALVFLGAFWALIAFIFE